jgi:hypothetical protein
MVHSKRIIFIEKTLLIVLLGDAKDSSDPDVTGMFFFQGFPHAADQVFGAGSFQGANFNHFSGSS